MGQISSINFKKSNAIQTRHNDRDLAPNYLLKSGGIGVECNRSHKEALELRNKLVSDAMLKYQEVVKQPFKAKSYEWSAVCNIKETTTMQDLETLSDYFQKEWGFQCYQIAIHRDEGHIDEQGKEQINQHAHLEFITLDKETGKNRYRREIINRKALSKIQDDVAKILGMERGVLKKISGRKRIEPRAYAKIKEQERKAIKQAVQKSDLELENALDKKQSFIDLLNQIKRDIEPLRKSMIGQGFEKESYRELSGYKKDIDELLKEKDLDQMFIKDFLNRWNEFKEQVSTAIEKNKELQTENQELKNEHKDKMIISLSDYKQLIAENESLKQENQTLKNRNSMLLKRLLEKQAIELKITANNQINVKKPVETIRNDLKPNSVNLNANNQIKQNQNKPKGIGRK